MLNEIQGEFKGTSSSISSVSFGERVRIIAPVNVYNCELGDDVFIGPFTEIQSQVKIGRRTKVQSHSFICSLVEIGEDCFIGHGVMFTNDLLRDGPARGDRAKWKGTKLGNRVSVGSNVTLLPVKICDDVVIGAGSVVTKDITLPGIYAGNPARLLKSSDE